MAMKWALLMSATALSSVLSFPVNFEFASPVQNVLHINRDRVFGCQVLNDVGPKRSSPSNVILNMAIRIRPGGDHGDMTYMPDNVMRQSGTFAAILQVGGKDCVNDIYVRAPGKWSEIFWYVGKTARCTGTCSDMEAVARQRPLIIEHAARLRPREIGKNFGEGSSLEVWVAPGDSELAVAYNRPDLMMQMAHPDLDTSHIGNIEVGFVGEIYQIGEEGFRTERTLDGRPSKPEIKAGIDRDITADEVEKMMKEKENNIL